MKKSLISAAILASAFTLSAAPTFASPVYNHDAAFAVTSTPTELVVSGPDGGFYDPGFFQFTVSPGTSKVKIWLDDTNPEDKVVTYSLFNDLNASGAGDAYTLGSQIGSSWTWTDNLAGNVVAIALAAGNYVLKIDNEASANGSNTFISAVPLPGAALLFGSGLLGYAGLRRRQKAKAA